MNILAATDWGRVLNGTLVPMTEPADYWIIHHSAGPADRPLDDELRIINADSISENKTAIDYSFLVNQAGEIGEGRGFGIRGAHTGSTVPAGQPRAGESYNAAGHAICFVGNYHPPFAPVPAVHPTAVQLEAAAWLMREGVRLGHVKPTFITVGHRDVKATACPGDNLYPLLGELHRAATSTPEDPHVLSDADLAQIRKVVEQVVDDRIGDCGTGVRRTVLNAALRAQELGLKSIIRKNQT